MNLKLSLEKAKEAYNKGTKEVKEFLENAYGKEHFNKEVDSYESACRILGLTPKTLSQFEELFNKEDARRQFARHKITTGIKAINGSWIADFENESQRKYYNWMYNESTSFSFFVFYYYYCGCDAGSDLYIENEEKAKVIQKVFKEDYKTFLFGY